MASSYQDLAGIRPLIAPETTLTMFILHGLSLSQQHFRKKACENEQLLHVWLYVRFM